MHKSLSGSGSQVSQHAEIVMKNCSTSYVEELKNNIWMLERYATWLVDFPSVVSVTIISGLLAPMYHATTLIHYANM